MQFTALELSLLLGGKLEGDPNVLVSKPAKIEEGDKGTVSFIANPKYESYLYTTRSSILIVQEDLSIEKNISPAIIKVKDAYSSFTMVLEFFNREVSEKKGIEESANISSSATIGEEAYIGAFSYIGEKAEVGAGTDIYPQVYLGDRVKIGKGSVVYPGVKIYHDCVIGDNCIIHSGVVIGSDGFGFAPQKEGGYKKVPQLGNVKIENNVEIGANTTIDRATVGSTIIRQGVKLDNLIQIAHNVEIGEDTVIAAQAGVSGSTKLGKQCMIGGQVGFVGHLKIADGTKINAQSGISKSISLPEQAWNGSPAFEYKDSLRSQVIFKRLPELEKRLEELESKIDQKVNHHK